MDLNKIIDKIRDLEEYELRQAQRRRDDLDHEIERSPQPADEPAVTALGP